MKERSLKIIIALMTITVIALITVQIYWIKSAIDLEEQRFDESVSEAVVEVRETIDKEKAKDVMLKRFGKSKHKNLFFFPKTEDSLKARVEKLKEKNKLVKEKVIELNDKIARSKIEINIDADSIKGDYRFNFWKDSNNVSFSFNPDSLDSIIKERSKVFNLAFREFIFSDEDHEIDDEYEEEVDSLLKITLAEKGIKTPYIINFEEDDDNLFFMGDDDNQKIFKVRLKNNPFTKKSETVVVQFPDKKGFLIKNMWLVLSISGLLILAIISIFYKTIRMLIKQKKIAEIKNDIISNITHEFKTPVSTISLAGEALKEPSVGENKQLREKYIEMISFENKRLSALIENLLNTASMEKGKIDIKKEELHVNKLLKDALVESEELLSANSFNLQERFFAENDKIIGDKFHLKQVFLNIIDNAVKYSKDKKELIVETENKSDRIIIKFSDKGIGIPRAHNEKIFDAFYRVPQGNIHDVKGHGIGLNYSKRIIEAHGGEILVKSKVNNGSEFIIKLKVIDES